MKKYNLNLLAIFAFLIIPFAQYAQFGSYKIIQKSGETSALKDQQVINLVFDYSNVKVGAYNSESEYIDKKVKEYQEKDPAKAEKWKAGWINARKERYEPKFEELFNKTMKKNNIVAKQGATDAKYTLVVKTTFIEPGFNVGVAKKPAFVNFEYDFIENSSKAPALSLYQNNVIGSQAAGFDFDVSSRVAESYAKGGKMLGGYIAKDLKKAAKTKK